MYLIKKGFFHDKIGNYYESKLVKNKTDIPVYTELIYHFDKSGNKSKTLKYLIKYVYNYLNTAHEFFPIVEDENVLDEYSFNSNVTISDIKEIDNTFFNISKTINEVLEQVEDKEMKEDLEVKNIFEEIIKKDVVYYASEAEKLLEAISAKVRKRLNTF